MIVSRKWAICNTKIDDTVIKNIRHIFPGRYADLEAAIARKPRRRQTTLAERIRRAMVAKVEEEEEEFVDTGELTHVVV